MKHSSKLSTIVKHLKALDEGKSDETVFTDTTFFHGETADIVLPNTLFRGALESYPLTPWALSQACQKVGTIPVRYARECPGWLLAENLNHWRKQLPEDRKWFLRFNNGECRGILSDRYSPLANSELAQYLLDQFGDGYDIVRPYYDADTLHLKFITMADPDDDAYAYGVYVGNGEVGNRSLTVAGFVQRHSCTNSIVLTDNRWRVTHVNKTKSEYLLTVRSWVAEAMQLSMDQRERLAEAALEEVEDFSKVVERLCKQNGLTNEAKDNVLMGSEGQKTTMGLVNGLSWAAHQQEDPELQIDLESLAGKYLRYGLQGVEVRQPVTIHQLETQEEEV